MLEIRNVQMLPDGQCRVETWGTWRFRILERGTLDGYGVARIERVDDIGLEEELELFPPPVQEELPSIIPPAEESQGDSDGDVEEGPSSTPSAPAAVLAPSPYRTNSELMAVCHAFLDQLREGTPWVVQHLDNAYVPMPEDPARFSFWMGLVRVFIVFLGMCVAEVAPIQILPIDEHEKAKLLPIRSPRLRLRLVVHWIEQLNSQW